MRPFFLPALIFLAAITITYAGTGAVISGEEDTVSFYGRISSDLLKKPAGDNAYLYIAKIADISRDTGRGAASKLLSSCAKKVAAEGGGDTPRHFLFNLYSGCIADGFNAQETGFRGIEKWLVSGPWYRYGMADTGFSFTPEVKGGFSKFKAVKATTENRNIFPFGYLPERRGIAYAGTSFLAKVPIRIWILSNARYRLFINGVETLEQPCCYMGSVAGISVSGAKNYSLLLKIADNEGGDDPFFRVIVTDEKNRILEPEISGEFFREPFTYEKIFSSGDIRIMPGFNERAGIADSYSEASSVVRKYPLYGSGYHALVPLLIRENRHDEFIKTVSEYKKRFPRSDHYLRWEAEYYQKRERKKFIDIMETLHLSYCDNHLAGEYIKALMEEGENSRAVSFSESYGDVPSLRGVTADAVKTVSSGSRWRKFLMERGAETGDPLYYYYMGKSEQENGLDPVLYWDKALSIRSDLREVREAADIYENGSAKGSVYYSGRYAAMAPEFLWDGIRRNVTVRTFENGRFMVECEELVPPALAGKGEFRLLPLKDLNVLYILKCTGGAAFPIKFETSSEPGKDARVRVESGIKSDFLVIKYTGYSFFEQYPFYIMNEMELKREVEDISGVQMTVIAEGWMSPSVEFNGKEVRGARDGENGTTLFTVSDNFNYRSGSRCAASIKYTGSEVRFSEWYNGLLKTMHGSVPDLSIPGLSELGTVEKAAAVEKYIKSRISLKGTEKFNPRRPEDVVISGSGSSEEMAILSLLILERVGVRGFIAFLREKGAPLTGTGEALLFVPESRGKGYWLRFGEKSVFKNPEAFMIKKDGFEVIPFSENVKK